MEHDSSKDDRKMLNKNKKSNENTQMSARLEELRQMGLRSQAQFELLLLRIQQEILKYDPLNLISHMHSHGYFDHMSGIPSSDSLFQFNVEIIQALAFVTSLLAPALSFCAWSRRRKSWRSISAMASLFTIEIAFCLPADP